MNIARRKQILEEEIEKAIVKFFSGEEYHQDKPEEFTVAKERKAIDGCCSLVNRVADEFDFVKEDYE